MGNCESLQDDFDTEWRFVGRGADLKKMKELLSKNRSVLVYGMKKIGKSRFMVVICKQLCESKKCVWKDFELDDIESGSTLYDWFIEFLTMLDALEEKERFKNKYPAKSIACNSCEKCQIPDRDKCLKRNDLIKAAVNTVITYLGKCEKEIVLFLDNIDKIMDSPLKDSFLYFHRQSLNCSKLRTVLASANKPKQTSKGYGSLELKQLENEAILQLLFETTEQRDDSSDEVEGRDETVKYSLDFQVFTPENRPYIKAIVGLCEGLPLAAAMSGLLLTEDDGLLKPAELVEILIRMRQESLSPDNCPQDDRLDIYKDQMEKLKDVASFFHCLNENMTGSQFSVDQAVAAAGAAGEDAATGAMVKQKILKKGLDRSILSIQTLSGKQQLKWHGILRECQAALKAIENVPGFDNAKDMVFRFMKENARNAGLDFDEETLRDPKSLERAIKSLSYEEKTPPPVQAKQDKEKGRLSLSEEDRLASKKSAITEFYTEQSPVMEVLKEVELSRAVENNPPNDSRKAKKLATRYSVSDGSDNSDSDSVNLQFTTIDISQTEGSTMNDVNVFPLTGGEQTQGDLQSSSPPPYTSFPGPSEVRATPYVNQSDENRYEFRLVNGQPTSNSVGEPPPRYTVDDPIHHLQNISSGQYVNDTLSDINPDSIVLLSRSLPSVQSPSYNFQEPQAYEGGNTSQVISSRDENCDKNLRRARSDPTCNRPETKVSRHSVDSPRREMDKSVNDSFTGPPAMNYIPPSIEIQGIDALYQPGRHQAVQHADRSMQAASLRKAELKDLIPATHMDHAFNQSGFSTQGPADISYKMSLNDDLHVDQISNIAPAQSKSTYNRIAQNGEMSPFQGHLFGNSLVLNPNTEETNAKRRSPTAIVRPMPKRRSPPNVDKQSERRNRIAAPSNIV